jgi:nucleoside-diphosphate-sugar epimerase
MVERGMKILITGGAGFIGHVVSHKLENLGHKVIILDKQTTYGIVEQELLDRLMEGRLAGFQGDFYNVDIGDTLTRIKIAEEKPDIVVHLAAYPRAKIVNSDPARAVPTMSTGLVNLLQGAANNGVQRFVYISSSMVYGDWYGGISERSACRPGSIYASLKLAGEQITKQFAKNHDFQYTIVRPSAVYGPRDVEDRVVSQFLIRAMRNEILNVHGRDETLDFSYVDDVAEGIVLATLKDEGANETFNITAGRPEFIDDAAHIMTTIVGGGQIRVTERNKEMPRRGYLQIAKAERLLGYEPKVYIEEGFQKYYAWAKRFYSIS